MDSVEIEDIYPLSPLQHGLLFHALYAPESEAYFGRLSCTLRGDLNVAAFRRAWQRVIDRHAIFRTAFLWEDLDEPMQVITQHAQLPFEQHDWRAQPPAEQQARWIALLRTERARRFDFTAAPLARLTLVRLADDAYRFLWSSHHLLLDGWSGSLVMREVFAYYSAFARGQDLALERPRPYREYIAWLQQQDLADAEAFWRRFFQGFRTPTPLGVDRAAGADQAERYAEQHLQLDQSISAALQALTRRHGLTMNTLVQGAWAILLGAYSGADDVVFGATVSGRPPDLPGVETMVGLFINTLPMRVRLAPGAPLIGWLQALQARQVELRQYEYSPLVQVQGWSGAPRTLPLFESLVVFENYPAADSLRQQNGSLAIRDVHSEELTNYPLTLGAMSDAVLALRVTYDCRRFDAATIARLIGHFRALFAGIAADPRRRLADLPLLTAAERQQILVEWNDAGGVRRQASGGRRSAAHLGLLHDLIARQAARTPDAIAVAFENLPQDAGPTTQDESGRSSPAHLAYGELNRRANQLAHALQNLGVGPDVAVALCVERSIELVVGLLGILKAGGAYVPLDPSYPQERLAFMLADSRAALLVSQERLAGDLPASWMPVVCLDSDWATIAQMSAADPASDVRLDNLAYVIYTSGSTGIPKGVMATHRGMGALAHAQIAAFEVRPDSRVLQFASPSFDAAVSELAMALLAGSTLCLPSPGRLLAGPGLAQIVRDQAITTATLPPTALATLPDAPLPALRTLITAGEACYATLLERWSRGRRILNAYGPTEATVCATIGAGASDGRDPPIGRPIANTQIYLLDAWLRPAPIGAAGEIHIGGLGLARGYLGRPDLTAERFVPNPFVKGSGVWGLGSGVWGLGSDPEPQTRNPEPRLYRTGDLARYRPDGQIEFLGRIDRQIKLRGFRIELGEVEAALVDHPAVRAAAVVSREDAPGDPRLVAYLVTSDAFGVTSNTGSAPDAASLLDSDSSRVTRHASLAAELREWLRARLPEHMIPAAFAPLDALPLTPNGKIDRRALPSPEQAAGSGPSVVAPRDTVELRLMHIWEDLLRIRPISVTANFFDLGGHSLLAMGLMAHIQQQFERELPLSTLFQGPTIEQLAACLRQQPGSQPWSPLAPIQRGDDRPPLFCVHPAGGNILCYADLARRLGPDRAVYGLQARGLEAGQDPPSRIEDMAADYVAALRVVQPHGPYHLGGWSSGGVVAFEMAQQLRMLGHQVALLALLDTQALPSDGAGASPDLGDADSIVMAIGEQNLPMALDAFRKLDLDDQLAHALAWARRTNLLPPDAGLSQARRFLQVFKANVLAIASYAPQPYPGRITLFAPRRPLADADAPDAGRGTPGSDETLGWGALSTQPVAVHTVPGTHLTMIFEPHAKALAEAMRQYL